MTSEVVLLNRSAVALAADSATTVSYREGGQRKQRHFKGTNKIFNLVPGQPVAIMTYASGNLQGVPWEVVIKAYRSHIGESAHDTLEEYAKDFFKFIEDNRQLYPIDFCEKQFFSDVTDAAGYLIYLMDSDRKIQKETDAALQQTMVSAEFPKIVSAVDSDEFIGSFSQADVDYVDTGRHREIVEALEKDFWVKDYLGILDFDALAALAVKALFKKSYSVLDNTGLVITGFGDKEYFAKLGSYRCYGFVIEKLVHAKVAEKSIDQGNTSEIVPFAQTSMAKAFMYGIAPDALDQISKEFVKSVDGLETELVKAGHLGAAVDIESLKADARNNFSNSLISDSVQSHMTPMRRVVGVLPIDELAELAEFLVKMESLKERATRETEEVSGPIDVAVISKGDGFIWIKRKLYFDPKLNPRFFTRRGMTPHV